MDSIKSTMDLPGPKIDDGYSSDLIIKDEEQLTYHSWRNVWDQNILFENMDDNNRSCIYRAMEITLPKIFDVGAKDSSLSASYIFGIRVSKNYTGKAVLVNIERVKFL